MPCLPLFGRKASSSGRALRDRRLFLQNSLLLFTPAENQMMDTIEKVIQEVISSN